jgi:hypothetical protein
MIHKIFMNFVEILKLFEFLKCLLKNSYKLQNILKNFEFLLYV